MAENQKTFLSEWCSKAGHGGYNVCFDEQYFTDASGQFICKIACQIAGGSELFVEGDPSTGKKKTTQSAAKKMAALIKLRFGDHSGSHSAGKYKTLLTEWANKCFNKPFSEVFNVKIEKDLYNQYVCTLKKLAESEDDVVTFKGDPSKDKKTTEFEACSKMWAYIESEKMNENQNICGPQLRYEALLGDKTLDYLLALAFYEKTKNGEEAKASHLHNLISSRSNNDRLRERMQEIGLEKTGNDIMDASRVEQWVWQQHKDCNYDIEKTLERIDPLLR